MRYQFIIKLFGILFTTITTTMQVLKMLFTLLGVLGCLQLSATLKPTQSASLLEHLQEVNKEWVWACDYLSEQTLEQPAHFAHETQRIQTHLLLVNSILAAKKKEIPFGRTTYKSQKNVVCLNQFIGKLAFFLKTTITTFVSHISLTTTIQPVP